jgi:serine/threonine protein kinase
MSILQIGKRLGAGGRFEIRKLIGRGGWAEVYEAFDRNLQKKVAIKVLHEFQENAVSRFKAEARAALQICETRLGNEYVVNMLYVSSQEDGDGDMPFLAMEFLEGRNLLKVVQETGPLETNRAVDVLLGACIAIIEAHACGIVHRDISLENLVVLEGPHGMNGVKMIDFGVALSSSFDHGTGNGLFLGTLLYVAPERFNQKEDGRSDQYSLAAVLYHALAGRPPFDAPSKTSFPRLLKELQEGRVRPLSETLPDLDPKLMAIVMKGMALDPSKRFASVYDFAQALLPFASDDYRAEYNRKLRVPPSSRISAKLSEKASSMVERVEQVSARTRPRGAGVASAPISHDAVTTQNPNPVPLGEAPTKAYPFELVHEGEVSASGRGRRRFVLAAGAILLAGAGVFLFTRHGRETPPSIDNGPGPALPAVVRENLAKSTVHRPVSDAGAAHAPASPGAQAALPPGAPNDLEPAPAPSSAGPAGELGRSGPAAAGASTVRDPGPAPAIAPAEPPPAPVPGGEPAAATEVLADVPRPQAKVPAAKKQRPHRAQPVPARPARKTGDSSSTGGRITEPVIKENGVIIP